MFFDNKEKEVLKYTLKKYKRSKSVKLLIRANGELIITAPIRVSQKYVRNFVYKHKDWIYKKLQTLSLTETIDPKIEQTEYYNYKARARELVQESIQKINMHYNFKYNKIFIRNQKTRWGSCSSKGNLNFSYKLALIPNHLLEYIVVHELCHLKEMNHGPNFWRLVEETVPDYKEARRELRSISI